MGEFRYFGNKQNFCNHEGTSDMASSYLLIGGDKGGVYRLNDPKNASAISDAVNITPSQASTAEGTIVMG